MDDEAELEDGVAGLTELAALDALETAALEREIAAEVEEAGGLEDEDDAAPDELDEGETAAAQIDA